MREVAVITGTTHGIGTVTSLELARAGHPVLMLCRDPAAGERVRAAMLREIPDASVKVVRCDLASLASVRECAARVRGECERIGLLINNAGIASVGHRTSVDGFELTFATNHLGPFLLTALLLDRLGVAPRERKGVHDVGELRARIRLLSAIAGGTDHLVELELRPVVHA